jgi:hypothetical protein
LLDCSVKLLIKKQIGEGVIKSGLPKVETDYRNVFRIRRRESLRFGGARAFLSAATGNVLAV